MAVNVFNFSLKIFLLPRPRWPACVTPLQLIAINDQTLAGAPFDVAMDALIGVEGPDVEFTLFRGSTDDLKEVVGERIHAYTVHTYVLRRLHIGSIYSGPRQGKAGQGRARSGVVSSR